MKMFKHFPKLVLSLSALAAVEILSLATAPTASAKPPTASAQPPTAVTVTSPSPALGFDFISGSVGIDALDIGKEFQVLFDGNVDGTASSALNSNAIFKFLGFTQVGSGSNVKTEANFDIIINNTTTLTSDTGDFFKSRVSVLGFDVKGFDGTTISNSSLDLLGVGTGQATTGNTRSTGIFTQDASGQMANAGKKEVCFSEGNCSGGASGGVGNTSSIAGSTDKTGSFQATLAMSGDVQRMALTNFGVRYQSIDGELNNKNVSGASGTGSGTAGSKTTQPPSGGGGPRKIPEPATTLGLGVAAISVLKLRKRNNLAEA